MAIYEVKYQSMSAFYGPSLIEADSEQEAKRIFAGSAFRPEEYGMIKARQLSLKEIKNYLRENNEE